MWPYTTLSLERADDAAVADDTMLADDTEAADDIRVEGGNPSLWSQSAPRWLTKQSPRTAQCRQTTLYTATATLQKMATMFHSPARTVTRGHERIGPPRVLILQA